MLFDVLDGYVARLSKTASNFGGQLDSLSDAISFGAAPAFLLLRLSREWHHELMRNATVVIAILFMICVLLRLARFNVENDPDPRRATGASRDRACTTLPLPAALFLLGGSSTPVTRPTTGPSAPTSTSSTPSLSAGRGRWL